MVQNLLKANSISLMCFIQKFKSVGMSTKNDFIVWSPWCDLTRNSRSSASEVEHSTNRTTRSFNFFLQKKNWLFVYWFIFYFFHNFEHDLSNVIVLGETLRSILVHATSHSLVHGNFINKFGSQCHGPLDDQDFFLSVCLTMNLADSTLLKASISLYLKIFCIYSNRVDTLLFLWLVVTHTCIKNKQK